MTAEAQPLSARRPMLSRGARRGLVRDLMVLGVLAAAYFILFLLTRDQPLPRLLEATARNVASLGLAAALARPWIRRVLRLDPGPQAAAHAGFALVFSFGWLWLLTVVGALLGADSVMRFVVNPFLVGPAAEWQLFQGLFAYGLLACLLALEGRPAGGGGVIVLTPEQADGDDRFLIREGESVLPLSAGRLVAIRGADDYSELVTLDGVRLVQTRLAEFERMLDPSRFLRVHRSAIINLDRMQRAEPAGGGRLLIHMEAGPSIHASRTGAKALRERLL